MQENGISKLNINNYIARKQINKSKTINDITITVEYEDVYMDYAIYKIKAQNNTNNTILLDSKEQTNTVYLTGNNDTRYRAFMYEIDEVYLTIKPRVYREFDIKFNKIYSPNIQEKTITFSDIIKNVGEYNDTQQKQNYTDRLKIEIDL